VTLNHTSTCRSSRSSTTCRRRNMPGPTSCSGMPRP
jgi:hypothetical protein